MNEKLIVHTYVNEVIGGAIRDVTLVVKRAGSKVLSARMKINEDCTRADTIKVEKSSDDDTEIHNAACMVVDELHNRGIEELYLEQLEDLNAPVI